MNHQKEDHLLSAFYNNTVFVNVLGTRVEHSCKKQEGSFEPLNL